MSNPFIVLPVRRPVLTTVIYLVVIVVGVLSLTRLPIDLMPEVEMPTISVTTRYGNAGPQEIEELVTRPIESALAGIQGIEEIVSTSSEGSSTVRVAFAWGTNLDEATNDIRDRIDRTLNRLPEDADRPAIRKFDPNAFPILILGVTSDMELNDLQSMIEDQVQYRVERVNGVASVNVRGGARREIQVALSASRLESFSISPHMVINALRQENRNMPAGSVEHGNREIMVRTLAEYGGVEEVSNTIITVRDGVPVRIADVAEVTDGLEETNSIFKINGSPAVRLAISKQSGTNTVAVAQGVHRELQRINRDYADIELVPLIDTSRYIEQSMMNMAWALLIGGIIAIVILLLFLRNLSTTLIISAAIPICIIATFALVYFSGNTLNMMTFGGLALGIGMLLDNAIVVLDSIFHKRENGENSFDGAVNGVGEVWSAVTASTLTTLVVFLPVVFIRGMSGIMFRSLALVVAFSLACSLIVALTLVPMLTSKFLRKPEHGEATRGLLGVIFRTSGNVLKGIEYRYSMILKWALSNRFTVVWVIAGLFLSALILIPQIGMELMPSADESEVRVNVEMEVGTKLSVMEQTVAQIEEVIAREVPEAEFIISNIGSGFGRARGANNSQIRISLVPIRERNRSSARVANELRPKLSHIAGSTIRVREGQGLFLLRMGTGGGESISVEVRGYELETAQQLAQQISAAVDKVDGVTDTRISREAGMPEYRVVVDRNRAADLGLTASQIGNAVQTAMGGTRATEIRMDGNEYGVLVRLGDDERKNIDHLSRKSVVNSAGKPIPLTSVSSIESATGPVQVERRDRERFISVDVNYAGRDMGSVVGDIRNELTNLSVPSGFAVLVRGDYEEQQRAYRELLMSITMAVLLVFLVMAGQFESFKDPFIVLFSIPMALIGVAGIMMITNTPFTIQAFIGCIVLTGIVVNNAIVLVDTVNRYRREKGMELFGALQRAGVRRLRPILMTTLTTTMGLLPLSIGLGEGGEAQAPMARVVIGGLLASTFITLVLIPVVYSFVEQRKSMNAKISDAN
ncbi:efflux RND transporter permease subunit [Chitinispirillales bacterium ANBcel5]|uniref:efflux RND transporter permease subunit n=1 Tax=Cellulosispirillum alkaliphilum TaxID=3039283 RepID=UPI002A53FD21|nr:efflux RND transporter permease subunit [Chitinispirillales bacterium ANBcel5]